jgi:hypothetical protein
LRRRRAATLAESLRIPLGRKYRYALWNGAEIKLNGVLIPPLDPLFCHRHTALRGATPYGDLLRYEVSSPREPTTSTIDVRFTELPVAQWHGLSVAAKRQRGIVGGAGVSIVRAGREIDFGWYFMGAKRRQNYDDWWRCEIRFSPELDELFGVTHSKQGITPSSELRALLEPDLERVARTLNARVRVAFEQLKAIARPAHTPAVLAAGKADRFLPPVRAAGAATRTRGSTTRATRQAERADGLRYTIEVRPIDSPEFFRAVQKDAVVTVIINRDHPFYNKVYLSACEDPSGHERFWLECMLLSAARAERATGAAKGCSAADMRHHWGDALAAFLES